MKIKCQSDLFIVFFAIASLLWGDGFLSSAEAKEKRTADKLAKKQARVTELRKKLAEAEAELKPVPTEAKS